MKSLDKRLGKQKRKILLLVDNFSGHLKMELQNIDMEFLMAGATATIQVGIMLKLNFVKSTY